MVSLGKNFSDPCINSFAQWRHKNCRKEPWKKMRRRRRMPALDILRNRHLSSKATLLQPVKLKSENTHLLRKGKYHYTADLLFDWLGFD